MLPAKLEVVTAFGIFGQAGAVWALDLPDNATRMTCTVMGAAMDLAERRERKNNLLRHP